MMGYKIQFEGKHLKFMIAGAVLFLFTLAFLIGTVIFFAFVFLSFTITLLPFVMDYFAYNRRQKDIEERFPDFVRNLVSAVKSGMPLTRAIIYVAKSDYGALDYHVQKMANQVEWNIPIKKIFLNFSQDVDNPIVKRAIATVLQAERSGGNIEDVLGSITDSLMTIKKLKQERKASIQGQITQSYIIFFIFLGVLITIQNVLIPYLADMETSPGADGLGGGQDTAALDRLRESHEFDFSGFVPFVRSIFGWFASLPGIFMMLALFQSFFAGIVLGKMSEGEYKSGLRHSLTMMFISITILSVANSMLAGSF